MKLTHENFESIINAITVEMILANANFTDRLHKSQKMGDAESKETFLHINFDIQKAIIEFMHENNMDKYEEGTTTRNMMLQFGQYLKSLGMLGDNNIPDIE